MNTQRFVVILSSALLLLPACGKKSEFISTQRIDGKLGIRQHETRTSDLVARAQLVRRNDHTVFANRKVLRNIQPVELVIKNKSVDKTYTLNTGRIAPHIVSPDHVYALSYDTKYRHGKTFWYGLFTPAAGVVGYTIADGMTSYITSKRHRPDPRVAILGVTAAAASLLIMPYLLFKNIRRSYYNNNLTSALDRYSLPYNSVITLTPQSSLHGYIFFEQHDAAHTLEIPLKPADGSESTVLSLDVND